MGAMSMMGGAGGGAVARVSRMPSPSIIASSTPPNAALFAALRMPARAPASTGHVTPVGLDPVSIVAWPS